jgi:uncharacterized protein (TIGR03000 family)
MKTRCLKLLIVAILATPAALEAQQPAAPSDRLTIHSDRSATRGPVYTYPNGFYSPFPGIWAPVPYPGWDYPPHWIYSYMRWEDPYQRQRRDEDRDGKAYRGRDTLSPAVPYSDYLKEQKDLLKARESAAKPAPTKDKALLEIRMPNDKARLFFDGKEAVGEGETRTFLTPPLKEGETYVFELKATWPGPDLFNDSSETQMISFRAGEHKFVDLRPKN